jgi:hypothetical protein
VTKPLALGALRIVDVMLHKESSVPALRKELGEKGWEALVGRLGEEPVEYLGSGFVGSAFLLESGKVLKFTNKAELHSADILMNDYSGVHPEDAEGFPPRREPHPNVIQIHDAFALLQNETEERIFGVGVVVKDAVDEVLDSVADPELFRAAERLVGNWEAPDIAPRRPYYLRPVPEAIEADCWDLEQWVERSAKLRLSPVEKALRNDLAAGIEHLLDLDLCPGDLLTMSNIGIKGGRAVFFDIMNSSAPVLTEEDIPVVWGPKR